MSWLFFSIRHISCRTVVFFTACIFLIAGCSSAPKEINPDPELKEIVTKKEGEADSPEHIILSSAKKSYQNQLYTVAKEQFTSLLSNFPTGPYAEFAEIKIADCSFYTSDYDLAAPLYEEYLKNHPGTLTAAYAALMAARSYHLSSKGVGHDAHALEKARELYSRLLELYPDSVYSKQAAAYQLATIEDLAANERAVADFYKKKGLDEAYAARIKVIEEKWQPMTKSIDGTYGLKADIAALNQQENLQNETALEEVVPEEPTQEISMAKVAALATATAEPIVDVTPEPTPTRQDTPSPSASPETLTKEETSEPQEQESKIPTAKPTVIEDLIEEATLSPTETPLPSDSTKPVSSLALTRKIPTSVPTNQSLAPTAPSAETTRIALRPASSLNSEEDTTSSPQPTTQEMPALMALGEQPEPIKLKPATTNETPQINSDSSDKGSATFSHAAVKVVQIECSNQNVFIFLDRSLPQNNYLKRYDVVEPVKGAVSVVLPGIKASQEIYDCFQPDDLTILKNGTISILTDKPMFVRYLSNPPKISLVTKRFTPE